MLIVNLMIGATGFDAQIVSGPK